MNSFSNVSLANPKQNMITEADSPARLDALFASLLDRAFKGEL
jgi:hypothetical protein